MTKIYALYKENFIPGVGGVSPSGIEVGLSSYNGWKLCSMDIGDFSKFSEFKLYIIPEAVAVGMQLLQAKNQDIIAGGVTALDDHDHSPVVELTSDELKLTEFAEIYIQKLDLKFITRGKVREFKDFEDDLTDTKRLIEFLLSYVAEDFSAKSSEDKAVHPMNTLLEPFLKAFSESTLITDTPEGLTKIMQILEDEKTITKIVKTNYIEKTRLI